MFLPLTLLNHSTVSSRLASTLLLFYGISMLGCASNEAVPPPSPESLDVSNSDISAVAPGYGNSNPNGLSNIDPAATFNWQLFFKPPVTREQRGRLERKLVGWTEQGNAKDLLEKGRTEAAIGKLAAAAASFRQAMRLDDSNLDVQLELAQLYIRQHRLENAFELLGGLRQSMAAREKNDPAFVFRYRYVLALALLEQGSHEKGHGILSDLLAQDRTFTPGYVALSSSYLNLGRVQVAEFIARRGLDRVKEDASIANLFGVIQEKQGQTEGALTWYNRALSLHEGHAAALVNRANLSIRRLEFAAAEEDLKQALTTNPFQVDALVSLAICQRRTGRLKEARASLDRAIMLDPDHGAARFNMAVMLADDLNQPHEATRLFREVLQTRDSNREIKDMARRSISDLEQNRDFEASSAL